MQQFKTSYEILDTLLRGKVERDGQPIFGNGIEMKISTRKYEYVDSKEAKKFFAENDWSILDIADVRIDEESIRNGLDPKKAGQLMQALRDAGCVKQGVSKRVSCYVKP